MGISILELVLQKLRDADFLADVAFPGQKYPTITQPVAAVHIEKVDRANLTVTVEVSIICPAEQGGTYCEVEALRATEVLRLAGATCVQNGCQYDGLAQVYVVSVLATFICIAESDNCIMGPGFKIYVDGKEAPYVISFEAERVADLQAQYSIGENAPVGIREGSWVWKIRLVELIPAGEKEPVHPNWAFPLELVSDTVTEIYSGCRWTSERREFVQQGLRRTRSGIALKRLEAGLG
jgi:hypothetical protein